MRFLSAVSSLALAAAAYAQSDPVVITVGQGGLMFTPQFVNVSANTVVSFVFVSPGNHSVSESSFATPCEPVDGGFSSGFVPTLANGTSGSWNLTVTDDTQAIWFYCAQGPNPTPKAHCESGMVGGINIEKSGKAASSFISNAVAATTFIQPSTALTGVGAFATASPLVLTGAAMASGSQTGASAASPSSTSPASASGASGASVSITSGATVGTVTNTASGAAASNTGTSGAVSIHAGGLFAFIAAALGVALL